LDIEEGTFMGCRSNAAALGNAACDNRALRSREAWRLAPEAYVDLQLVLRQRTNLLLIADPTEARAVVELLLTPEEGAISWCPGQPLELLPLGREKATLVLHDVDQLTLGAQAALVNWLDQNVGKIRVLSTTTAPLWPRVQNGSFNEVLFYRLNIVCLGRTEES
jgi:hypothetical protein